MSWSKRQLYTDTKWSDWTPTYGAGGSMTFTSVTTHLAKYSDLGSLLIWQISATGTTGGTAHTDLTFTLPFNFVNTNIAGPTWVKDAGTPMMGHWSGTSNNIIVVRKSDDSNWTLGASTHFSFIGITEKI